MAAYEEIYAGMGDKAARTADRFIELIKALVEDKKGTRTFHEMSDNGLKTILRHVKKGGDVRMQDVPSEYAPVFEAILKSQGIPYIAMDSGKGEDRHRIYITRDKDNGALEDVWRKFRMEMNVGMNELSVSQFIKENQGQDIRRSKGYDLVETEVFRRKMAEHGGAFAVTESDEERGKFTTLLDSGFADTFRSLHPTQITYSWWSYRFQARAKNAGWRIDYFVVSNRLMDNVEEANIHTDIMGSDHCPVEIILNDSSI